MAKLLARMVRENVKALGTEQGLIKSLEVLCEELIGLRQESNDMAQILNSLIDRFGEMVDVQAIVTARVDQQRLRQQGVEILSEPVNSDEG